ncbi:MAG: tetratricopeptide repeat protein [Leptolyngbya sp. SIO4C5]|nr:tetratricopeptide repeat protein [Leptolyngbya sp. SIO4C5]
MIFRTGTLIALSGLLGAVSGPIPAGAVAVHHSRFSSAAWQTDGWIAQEPSEFEYEEFDFWAEQCRLLSEETDYTKTLETCEQAIALEPDEDNIDLWAARSYALFQLGEYLEAIASYGRILQVAPRDSISLAYQCAAFYQLNRYDEAVDTCESALQINGSWGDRSPAMAWYYRGLALQSLGRLETALDSFERALAVEPEDVMAKAGLCVLATELYPYADEVPQVERCSLNLAVDTYEQALAVNPDDAALWVEQGLALEQLGDYERALTSYERAIALLPDYSLALAHQCAVLTELSEYEAAAAACEAALQGNNNWGRAGEAAGSAYGWAQQGAALIGLGDYEAALAAAERAIAIKPDYPAGWNNQAVSLWHLDDAAAGLAKIEQALTLYDELLSLYQDDRNIPGEAFERDYAELPVFFHRGRILALFNHGRILTSLNDFDGAIAAYLSAIRLHAEQHRTWGFPLLDQPLLANLYANHATAHILSSQIMENSCAQRSGQLENAISSASNAANLHPDAFANQYTLGLVQLYSCNYWSAREAFEAALTLEPENVYAVTGLGIALTGLQARQSAVETFEQALNLNPDYTLAQSCRDYLLLASAETAGGFGECTQWLR